MDQNRDESSARVSGPDTGPLPPQGAPPSYGGQPTTYVPPQVPPEIRPQGTFSSNYAGETPSAPPPPVPPYPSYAPAQQAAPAQTVYHDRRPHRTPILGPLLLISAGIVFLLNNMGVLPWSVWETLGRLWPLILIAIGIDLIIGRRNPFVSVLIVLAVLGAGAAFIYSSGGFTGSGQLTTAPLLVQLNSAQSADVRVDLGVGNLTLGSMEGEHGVLAAGRLEYFENHGAPRQDVSENDNIAEVEIREAADGWHFGFGWFGGGRSPSWVIDLNERVPIDLHVDSGTGNTTLSLERLQLTSLTVDAGTGNASITLPSQAKDISVEIDGGTGNLEVFVPDAVEAHIEIDSGIGNTNVDNRFSKRGEDTYESSGFATATNKVTIKINHGVGNVNVRSK